ncbi:prenyl cysteine carboxyl methyltransferase, putative [Glarea lozoyensis ATCC 20868]|uniref:Protein-S-isoprenylcysteine O-methyltransferase n=1 Tax=Glarea lozoyensis (strain ATCC 20868 / MF5171) TaxID=1116229 RepID=S3CFG9_GLAL2|nr:prenyl cysteine carboxyl methyltransferase, putative [Glarea lozoyensis ATCC 20868]EPE24695.1 prenyl cysteine carboxyl methyltransferase, putative [Glarea lozoyensis ATCC 20868]
MNLTPSSLSLTCALIYSTYLSYLCIVPPNPPPQNPHKTDRLNRVAALHSTAQNHNILILLILLWTYHLTLLLFPGTAPYICLNPDLLNPSLFTWSVRSTLYIIAVCTSSWIRLASFRGLGKEFTFTLAVPKKLITSGVYAWVQHPSYIGLVGLRIVDALFVMRFDGVAACVLPRKLVGVPYLSEIVAVVMMAALGKLIWMRILDEEEMMRGEFGDEWERWHGRTARLIPGVF